MHLHIEGGSLEVEWVHLQQHIVKRLLKKKDNLISIELFLRTC